MKNFLILSMVFIITLLCIFVVVNRKDKFEKYFVEKAVEYNIYEITGTAKRVETDDRYFIFKTDEGEEFCLDIYETSLESLKTLNATIEQKESVMIPEDEAKTYNNISLKGTIIQDRYCLERTQFFALDKAYIEQLKENNTIDKQN